ncbi:pentatricopeptide repeat-containing protein At1g62670, mitochondrial [Selaginella moellendorffii]|uniref:pentatricopeptide repeat-containing protein At1g62670, mitochondrial n=1 Tax=Selaginella moellendorffii TaxID=88036 RepID=UPI000D1CE941|nr:pentatricopeptide repeat-containing protein At1g62670, mitochondrial [Selaginella moellendorffii]|eukprot:XP_024539000.1 pentatricopeptide repeat-containing protein At1g62670, mitochondrial [Selaginella moellendorffii]
MLGPLAIYSNKPMWVWRTGARSIAARHYRRFLCSGTQVLDLSQLGAGATAGGEAPALDVFKILGLFRDKKERECVDAVGIVAVLRDSSDWQGRLEEIFRQQPLNSSLVEDVVRSCDDPDTAVGFFRWSVRQDSCVSTLHSYNCIIRKLVEADLVAQAEAIVEEMKYAGFSPDVQSHCLLIRGFFKSGSFQRGCSQLDRMLEAGLFPNAILYNNLISCLCKAGMLAEAESYLKRMPQHCAPNVVSYNIIIDGYCKARNIEKALAFLREMEELGHPPTPHAYSSIVQSFCKTGNVSKAMDVFAEMPAKGCEPDIVNFNVLLSGLWRARKIHEARELFRSMNSRGCKPDVVTYNTMIAGLCKWKKLDEAVFLLERMKQEDVSPTFVTYTTLIDHLCKFTRLQQAYEVFEKMAEGPCACTEPAYSVLFNKLQRAGKLVEASRVYSDMCRKNVCMTDNTYSLVVLGLSKMDGGNVEAAKLVTEMMGKKIAVHPVAFNVFLNKLCIEGGIDEAIRLFRQMCGTELYKPDFYAYSILINGLCKARRPGEAKEMFQEMRGRGISPTVVTYNTLLEGLLSTAKLQDAMELTYFMLDQGVAPRIATLTKLLYALVWKKRMDEALKLYEAVTNEGVMVAEDGESLDLVVFPYSRKSGEGPSELFDATVAKGLVPSTGSCNVILDRMIKEHRFEEAKKLFSDMKTKRLPDTCSYNLMIRGFCANGDTNEAYCLFQDMIKDGIVLNTWTYNFMIVGFIKDEAWSSAWMLFKRMQSGKNDKVPAPNMFTYEILISSLCKTDQVEEAFKLLSAMRDKGFVPSLKIWEVLLSRLARAGRLDDAFELYKEMSRINCQQLVGSSNILLDGILRRGSVDEAKDFLKQMTDTGIVPDKFTYDKLVVGLCWQGKADQARKLVEELVRDGKRPENQGLRQLLGALCAQGDFQGAYEFYCWLPSVGVEVTLGMHNTLVTSCCLARKLDYLDMIEQREGVPDVIVERIEKFRAELFREEEVKIYEETRDRKIRRTMAYSEPRRPKIASFRAMDLHYGQ